MSEKHDTEPWDCAKTDSWIDDDTNAWLIMSADGDVAEILSRAETAEGNARRIVAAVNACRGIPTTSLTPGIVAELVEALTHMRYCAHCAESDWNDCEGGRAALAALARVRPTPEST